MNDSTYLDRYSDRLDQLLLGSLPTLNLKQLAIEAPEVLNQLRRAEMSAINESYHMIGEISQNTGIYSLSEINDSILMWSHYGDNHKGLCLEFNREESSKLSDEKKCKPVIYSNYLPNMTYDYLLEHISTWVDYYLYYKSMDWSYEKEWRLISTKGNVLVELPNKINAVYTGVKISKEQLGKLSTLCKEKNIELYIGSKSIEQYKIIYERKT